MLFHVNHSHMTWLMHFTQVWLSLIVRRMERLVTGDRWLSDHGAPCICSDHHEFPIHCAPVRIADLGIFNVGVGGTNHAWTRLPYSPASLRKLESLQLITFNFTQSQYCYVVILSCHVMWSCRIMRLRLLSHHVIHDLALHATCQFADDVQVRFFEESEDGLCWEAFGQFTPQQDVHHQVTTQCHYHSLLY